MPRYAVLIFSEGQYVWSCRVRAADPVEAKREAIIQLETGGGVYGGRRQLPPPPYEIRVEERDDDGEPK